MTHRTFVLNKLVRDGILAAMYADGQIPDVRTLTGGQLIEELCRKLTEESAEISATNPAEALKELADLKEVFDSLVVALGSNLQEIEAIQHKKRATMGGFEDGSYVGTLKLPVDSSWVDYYAADPERFPEVTE